jgi:hypothetical protein
MLGKKTAKEKLKIAALGPSFQPSVRLDHRIRG